MKYEILVFEQNKGRRKILTSIIYHISFLQKHLSTFCDAFYAILSLLLLTNEIEI